MIDSIDDHKQNNGTEPICKVLLIARFSCHLDVAKRTVPARLSLQAKRDLTLKHEIKCVFARHFGVYGVRKV